MLMLMSSSGGSSAERGRWLSERIRSGSTSRGQGPEDRLLDQADHTGQICVHVLIGQQSCETRLWGPHPAGSHPAQVWDVIGRK